MMAMVGFVVFAGALALSVAMIVLAVGPQWRRIARLARGRIEQSFSPLEQLAMAEHRIAVRRWASAPLPSGLHRTREAA